MKQNETEECCKANPRCSKWPEFYSAGYTEPDKFMKKKSILLQQQI